MNITPLGHSQTLLDFALKTYAKPEVEGLCLELQDRYGGQVNILLWAAWLDAQGGQLDRELLGRAQAIIAAQERYWLRPVRRLRRAIPRAYFRLRHVVKRLELQAEYWQLRRLMSCSPLLSVEMKAPEIKAGGYRLEYLYSLDTPEDFQARVERWIR